MSYSESYSRGDWLAICESCGRVVKASQLRKRWDGVMVDDRCFEYRQPQDFVRGVADIQAPPWTRPEPADTFVNINNAILTEFDLAIMADDNGAELNA